MVKDYYILGIESSCDDTAASVLRNTVELSNVVSSQAVHQQYGGVVPELASRAHQMNIMPTVSVALEKAGISKDDISAIAYTQGPGLLGSLLVGGSFAAGLSLALDKPVVPVNHMEAHILAHFIIPENEAERKPVPDFPFVCLTVSGGHTQLVRVNSAREMTVLGQTIDDAAGEAFDKTAKLLGLPYPGGPVMDSLAENGDPFKFKFPVAKIPEYNFSFSGLKTSVLYKLTRETQRDAAFIEKNKADLAASIRKAICDALAQKAEKAIDETGTQYFALAGGVSANKELRKRITDLCNRKGVACFVPELRFCTDNAAMIACAGYFKLLERSNVIGTYVAPRASLRI